MAREALIRIVPPSIVAVIEGIELEGFEVTPTGAPLYLRDINDYLQGGMLTLGVAALIVMAVVLALMFRVRWRLLPNGWDRDEPIWHDAPIGFVSESASGDSSPALEYEHEAMVQTAVAGLSPIRWEITPDTEEADGWDDEPDREARFYLPGFGREASAWLLDAWQAIVAEGRDPVEIAA